ncbi:MAG TPA: L,D-transpeptidase [Paracoccaceae bacterium]|nr:L,D-transpeptidase [Paracoccaceae bacterium]HMO70646.1 L,D-transpeptidase [Paracoccaceae bacterium]
MSFQPISRRLFLSMAGSAAVTACAAPVPDSGPVAPQVAYLPFYGPMTDSGIDLPAIPAALTEGVNRRATGTYLGEQPVGTIDVDPYAKFLYFVREGANTIRYPIGAGRAGRAFAGNGTVQVKRKWPGWTPTRNMLRTEPDVYGPFSRGIPGGRRSPLGARALYLYRGGRDTFYRIHGTNDMESIGNSGSAGCIRLFNHDIIHLFDIAPIGTPVHVRSESESLRVDPENFNRGIELPARRVDPDSIYSAEAIANDPPPIFGGDGFGGGDDVPL